jgi:hypothetical protein
MKRILGYLSALVLVAIGGLAIDAAPALAVDPIGAGWTASWQYTSATTLTTSMTITGAAVSMDGADNAGSRTFAVSLTDSSRTRCAYLLVSTDTLSHWVQCGGTTTLALPSYTGDFAYELCDSNAYGQDVKDCNVISIPDSSVYPFIRTAGDGLNVSFYATAGPYDWQAHQVLGPVHMDWYGHDIANQQVEVSSWLTVAAGAPTSLCGYAEMDGDTGTATDVTQASLTLCGGGQSQQLPTVTHLNDSGQYGVTCEWSTRRYPLVKDCLTAQIIRPS